MIENSLFNMNVLKFSEKLNLNVNQKKFLEERKNVLHLINNYNECILYLQEKICYQDVVEYFKNKPVFEIKNVSIAGVIICRNEEDNIINLINNNSKAIILMEVLDFLKEEQLKNILALCKENNILVISIENAVKFPLVWESISNLDGKVE